LLSCLAETVLDSPETNNINNGLVGLWFREKVIIDIEDVNDHSPEWKTNLVSVEIEEKRIYGHIIRLKATDLDGTEAFSRICQYKVVTPDSPFVVDKNGASLSSYTFRLLFQFHIIQELY